MITHCRLVEQHRLRLLAVLCLALILGGCATGMSGTDYRSNAEANVPEYVQNLPKSRTGNMAHYTVFGKRYQVMDSAANFSEQGKASWYGAKFHGRKTSSGEIYDMYAMTAAHKHLPLPTFVRVTNLDNNKSIVVKVNDRGPFVGKRIIDLSLAAAEALDMVENGTAEVRVDGLSTHLVAENRVETNVEVAQAIDNAGSNTQSNTFVQAPAVLEPELASVPLPVPATMVELPTLAAAASVEPNSMEPISVDTEDGFVELTEPAVGPNNNAASTNNVFIQLGAFSHAPNAHSLVVDVAERVGLPAYVEQDATRSIFRVKMGPFKEGGLLNNTLSELADVGIDGYTMQAASR